MSPGSTLTTATPISRSSAANVFDTRSSAALLAPYTPHPGYPPMAASLEMFTTRPCDRTRRGSASWMRARGAIVSTSRTRRKLSREAMLRGGRGVSPRSEALFTRTSIWPQRPAGSRIRRRWAASLTSPGIDTTGDPVDASSAAALRSSASPRAVMIRTSPCFARKPARIRPSPRLAPVMTASFFESRKRDVIEVDVDISIRRRYPLPITKDTNQFPPNEEENY